MRNMIRRGPAGSVITAGRLHRSGAQGQNGLTSAQ